MTNLKRRTRSSDTFQNTHKAAAVSFSALKRRFLWGFFFSPSWVEAQGWLAQGVAEHGHSFKEQPRQV